MKLDLHTHTKNSDGELSVLEQVSFAKKHGLSGIAITDHDNIDSWDEIDKIEDFLIIKGIELSTFYNGSSVHVLGYLLDEDTDITEFKNFLLTLKKSREERVKKMISLLQQFDIYLEYEDVLNESDGSVGRPHVASLIMKKYPSRGYTKKYLFDNYIGNDKPAYVPTYNLSTKEGIKLLKRFNFFCCFSPSFEYY